MGFLRKLLDSEYKELTRFEKMADEVLALDDDMSKLSDEDIKNKTAEFKMQLKDGATLEDIIIPAFALAREACYRGIGEKPFRVQVIGGFAIHYGNIAEMKTGEGKTLTTVLPAYLNALEGKGVHVVTTNEYLSARNAEWMGPIYDY
jgi:preprotein translocase subunit SecA